MARTPQWTEEAAIEALREFRRAERRPPTDHDLHSVKEKGLPGHSALVRLFGSTANAYVLAFGDAPSQNSNDKDLETAEVIQRLATGMTLTEIARELGVTGQALGRRVNRYQRVHGLRVVKRKPGRPRQARRR